MTEPFLTPRSPEFWPVIDGCLRNPRLWREPSRRPSWAPRDLPNLPRFYRAPSSGLFLPLQAAFTRITAEGVGAGSTNSNNVTTAGINTTGANFAVLALASYQAVARPTISDSGVHTWNALTDIAITGDARCTLFWALLTSVGAGHTATASGTGSYPAIYWVPYSGAAASPFDQQNGDAGSAPRQTGNVTPTENN